MLKITQRLSNHHSIEVQRRLFLPYDLRQKSRFRATMDNGDEVGIMLPRGTPLRDGDLLKDEFDRVIQIRALAEAVTNVYAEDTRLFAQLCYHLGNRHVPLQVGDLWARYLVDHVLDEMVVSLGARITHESIIFEPVSGAYHSHHHD